MASTVESAAKDSGYNISLGSKAVASSLQQQQLQQQLQQQAQQQRYGGISGQAGYASMNDNQGGIYSNGMHKSSSEATGMSSYSSPQPGAYGNDNSGPRSASANSNRNGFSGFDDKGDEGKQPAFNL